MSEFGHRQGGAPTVGMLDAWMPGQCRISGASGRGRLGAGSTLTHQNAATAVAGEVLVDLADLPDAHVLASISDVLLVEPHDRVVSVTLAAYAG